MTDMVLLAEKLRVILKMGVIKKKFTINMYGRNKSCSG